MGRQGSSFVHGRGICMRTLIRLVILVTAFCGLAGRGQAQPVRYIIDPKQAEVLFSYSLTLASGVGRFTRMSGTANIDDAALDRTTVQAVIDTRTLRAGNSMAQSELRGADFFDVARIRRCASRAAACARRPPQPAK